MTTYDKETYAKLAEWANAQSDKHSALGLERDEITNQRNDLVKEMQAKFPLINAYKKTGELDESLLPIIDGIPHEADNGTNGGVTTPVGESEFDGKTIMLGRKGETEYAISLEALDVSFKAALNELPHEGLIWAAGELMQLADLVVETPDAHYLLAEKFHSINCDDSATQTLVEAGWRDDVPDESKPDQENVSVPQEGEHIIEKTQAHDHGGMVVEGDVFERATGSGVLERRIVTDVGPASYGFVEDEGDGRDLTGKIEWTLARFQLVTPSPLREQDKQDVTPVCDVEPESETVEVDNPESTQESEGVVCGSGQSTGTETCGEQTTNSSEGISLEDEQAASGDTDSALSVDSDNGNNVLSRTSDRNAEVGSRAAQTENQPLASWIMEQEWIENITADITEPEKISYIMGEYVLEGGTVVNIEELLSDFTPKGWERYVYPSPIKSGFYDTLLRSGQSDTNIEYSNTGWHADYYEEQLFIREHQPESKNYEQEAELEAGEGKKNNISTTAAINNECGSGQKDTCGDGRGEDNGLEYLIKEQATELTEAEQKAVDLIEGRVGDELDKLEETADV